MTFVSLYTKHLSIIINIVFRRCYKTRPQNTNKIIELCTHQCAERYSKLFLRFAMNHNHIFISNQNVIDNIKRKSVNAGQLHFILPVSFYIRWVVITFLSVTPDHVFNYSMIVYAPFRKLSSSAQCGRLSLIL